MSNSKTKLSALLDKHLLAQQNLSPDELRSNVLAARDMWGHAEKVPVVLRKSADVTELQTERIENGFVLDAPEHGGYTLIGDCLVHEYFICRVMNEIMNCTFEAGCIFDEDYLFSREFVETLDDQEVDVLMDVALLLLKDHLGTDRYEELYLHRFGCLPQGSTIGSDTDQGGLRDAACQWPITRVGGAQ